MNLAKEMVRFHCTVHRAYFFLQIEAVYTHFTKKEKKEKKYLFVPLSLAYFQSLRPKNLG